MKGKWTCKYMVGSCEWKCKAGAAAYGKRQSLPHGVASHTYICTFVGIHDLQCDSYLLAPSRSCPIEKEGGKSLDGQRQNTRHIGHHGIGGKGREVRSSVHGPGSVTVMKQCASPTTPASWSQCSVSHIAWTIRLANIYWSMCVFLNLY